MMHPPARILLRVLLSTWIVVGCGSGPETADPALAIDTPSENTGLAWSMAADALDGESDFDRETVIVPSNDALLGLDADALADLLSTNRLLSMLSDSIIRAGFDDAVEPGDVYLMTNSESVRVTEEDGQLLLNDYPLLQTVTVGAATILVIDGVVVAP